MSATNGEGQVEAYSMFTVYGDESHDQKRERVFTVAGVLSHDDEWHRLEARWISRTGGKAFHAADCESDSGDYYGIDHSENLTLYKDLTQVIADSDVCGFAVAIDLAAHREHFPESLAESPYHRCFFGVLLQLGEIAFQIDPSQTVKFIFDQRTNTDFSAGQLYEWTGKQEECAFRGSFAEDISFSTRELVGIQVADLLAREAMKEIENNVGPRRRQIRKSMVALLESKRLGVQFYTRSYFEDFSAKFGAVSDRSGLNMEAEFLPWLNKMGLTDNWANRMRYANHVQFMDSQRKLVG